MGKYKNYIDVDIIKAVKSSTSKRQCIVKLGLVPAGGNYATLNRAIERLNLNIEHFKGKGWNKGIRTGYKKELKVYLNNEYRINSHRLKLRLFKEGIKEQMCENCERKEWIGKQIPLELHHVDGNKENNNLNNLQILCPNCHSFTDTYRVSKN